MKTLHLLALSAFAVTVCLSTQPVEGATQTNNPIADAYVQSNFPTNNYGTATTLFVRTPASLAKLQSYLKFDLSSVASLKTATLRLSLIHI